jgi:hypothetical protein
MLAGYINDIPSHIFPSQGTTSRPRSSCTIPPPPPLSDGIDHPALMSDSKSATAVMQKNPNGTNDGSKGTVSV